MAAQCAALAREREERGVGGRDLVVQPRDDGDRGLLEPRALRVARLVQPVPLVRIGHDVGRHPPRDPLHDEERGAERPGVLLQPQHARHGHVGAVGDQAHGAVLALHVVHGKDRVRGRVRREAQRAPGERRSGVLDVEEERLAGHAVRLGHRHVDDFRARQMAAEPGREAPGQVVRVPGRGAKSGPVGFRCHVRTPPSVTLRAPWSRSPRSRSGRGGRTCRARRCRGRRGRPG